MEFYRRAMKTLALLLLVAALFGCTTLADRRDLYSPEPARSYEATRQMRAKSPNHPTPARKPQFR
jgi:hypothetical protein